MRIVYLHYLYDIRGSSAGAYSHVQEIVNALRSLGHFVNVYNLNRYSIPEESNRQKVRYFFKKRFSRYLGQINAFVSNARYFRKEWGLVKKDNPDIILMRYNLLNFSLPILARINKIPLAIEVNAPMAYESKRFNKKNIQLSFLAKITERLNLRLANNIIVVSNELKKFYISKWKISSDNIFVVPNGVDENKFSFNKADMKLRIKYEYDLSNKIVLGFVGTFHYWHGIDALFDLIKSLVNRYENIVFLLVGNGPLRNELENLVRKNYLGNRVIFSGYIEHTEIPAYLSLMDIVLAPYPNLDFFYYSPLKIFEYMASGKAIIASRIGQISEIIQDGVNGMLFDTGNFNELRNKAILLIENKELRERIGINARLKVIKNYTWKKAAKKISKILENSVF